MDCFIYLYGSISITCIRYIAAFSVFVSNSDYDAQIMGRCGVYWPEAINTIGLQTMSSFILMATSFVLILEKFTVIEWRRTTRKTFLYEQYEQPPIN